MNVGEAVTDSSLEVTIQTEDGSTIPNADVQVFRWSSGLWKSLGSSCKTDQLGQAKFADLPSGEYLTVIVRASGLAPTQQDFELGKSEERSFTVKLSKAVSSWIRIEDEEGKPIPGAEVNRLSFTDTNASTVHLNSDLLQALYGRSLKFPKSGDDGRISLPPLPEGAKVDAWVIHPQFALAKKTSMVAGDGELGRLTLKRGTKVRVEFTVGSTNESILDGTTVDVTFFPKHGGSQSAETINSKYRIEKNAIEFTAAAAEYRMLRVAFADYFPTSKPSNDMGQKDARMDLRNKKRTVLPVTIHPKVRARGRVVDGEGKPLGGVWVSGTVANPDLNSKTSGKVPVWEKWVSAGDAQTDADGFYEIDLISAEAQVEAIHEGYFGDPSVVRVDVAESKEIGNITLRPVPTLKGRVLDPNGNPASGKIVRFRCIGRSPGDPICLTDADGKFELKLDRVPYLPLGSIGLQTDVFVIGFDPKSNLAGRASVDLKAADQTSNIVVQLAERGSDWIVDPLVDQPYEMSEEMKKIVDNFKKTNETLKKKFANGLPGKKVPDMSNGTWLNTSARSLEDFRGQYVLLDFWFIGCGPCFRDMPSVKIAQKAYSDLGFTVVSFHIKSQTPDNVKKFADANKMNYPIVVDNSNGDIEAAYRKLGLSGFPHYILLDPEGKVLINDCFWNSKQTSLREHKLELIHQAMHTK